MQNSNRVEKTSNWFLSRPKITGSIFFIICFFLVIFISSLNYERAQEKEYQQTQKTLKEIENRIDEVIEYAQSSTLTIALTINSEGIPTNFDSVAAPLIASAPYLDALQLAPLGIVRHTYPLKGNEVVEGFDILKAESRNKEAMKAIKLNKIYFAGPLDLQQGGLGIIGRMPVYQNNKFWGFSSTIIMLERLFENSGIYEPRFDNYSFQFSKLDPNTNEEVFFLPLDKEIDLKKAQSYIFPEANWKLYVISSTKNTFLWRIILLFIGGTIVSILISLFVTKLLQSPEKLRDEFEEQLFLSEKRFKTLTEYAPVGIFLTKVSGECIYTNDKWREYAGMDEKEPLGKGWSTALHPDDKDRVFREWKESTEKNIPFSSDYRFIDKNKFTTWLKGSATPLTNSEDEIIGYIGTIIDITERKEMELQISKTIIEAQEAERQDIGRELHDNINQILSASVIMMNVYMKDPSSMEYLQKSRKYSQTAIDEIRKLSHQLSPSTFIDKSMEEAFEDLISDINIDKRYNTNLLFDKYDYAKLDVNIKMTLFRILQEQLSNITKHSRANSIKVTVSTTENHVIMITSDNGQGFDLNLTKTGVGLNNMKRRAELVNGSMETTSSKKIGTQITVRIPLE